MIRFICWIMSLCLFVGAGDAIVRLTLDIAQAAVHAHQQDQMSYAKFTKAMLSAKPRKPKSEPNE
jgi:hypothetical protein